MVPGLEWDLGAAAVAGHKGCIGQTAETMAGTEVGCMRIVGFGCGWVAGREEGHSGNLDPDLDLVAMGLGSLIVGKMDCSRLSEGC